MKYIKKRYKQKNKYVSIYILHITYLDIYYRESIYNLY